MGLTGRIAAGDGECDGVTDCGVHAEKATKASTAACRTRVRDLNISTIYPAAGLSHWDTVARTLSRRSVFAHTCLNPAAQSGCMQVRHASRSSFRRHPAMACLVLSTAALAGCGQAAAPTAPASSPAVPVSSTPTQGTSAPGSALGSVTYCTVGRVALTMNVWLPQGGTTPHPLAVMVHGGGWEHGDAGPSNRLSPVESGLVGKGFVVASVNYRLAPQYVWPAQIEDVKCAIRYLRASAATYGIDPTRLGVWGGSAGGHLVSMLGTAGPSAGYDVGQYLDQSSAVQAVVDEWGPADLTAPGWGPYASQVITQVFGESPGQPSSVLRAASPVSYVTASDPPFLIIQGVADTTVPASQSQEFAATLQSAGVPETLVMVQNAGHGLKPAGGVPTPSVSQVNQMVVDFFTKQLGAGR
ncbi:MAG: alpha/beta hydrolase [Chloroflexi bacterium]|nr:MAG: alpha/beta hydrolase [Chloroflexota bacterium]